MTGTTGFLTRQDARNVRTSSRSSVDLPLDAIRRLGPKAVRGMNPTAKTPEMLPTGAQKPDIYVLGEAPGAEEDLKGEQFIGQSGQLLRECFPEWIRSKIRFDNVVRTRPPKNRTPKPQEIEAFRELVEKSIEEAKPKAILGVGGVPLQWAVPGAGSIKACRGRRFPIKIRSHVCWFYPVVHPAWLLRIQNGRVDQVDGSEWKRYFEKDIQRVIEDLEKENAPKVLSSEKATLFEGVEVVTSKNHPWFLLPSDLLEPLLAEVKKEKLHIAFDLETSALRPYGKGAKILSFSFSTGSLHVSHPFDHSMFPLSDNERSRLLLSLRNLFGSGARLVAHNLNFDLEWMLSVLSKDILEESRWGDSMQAAYVLDERKGALSLNFLCAQEFGLPLKSLTVGGSYRGNMEAVPLEELLKYNALDSKYTWKLYKRLRKRVEKEGLLEVYKMQVDRVLACVGAQKKGLPVDQKAVSKFSKTYDKEIQRIKARIELRPEVKKYKERFGSFSPASPKNLVTLFTKVLNRREGEREGGKYSTDEEALAEMKAAGVGIASDLLEFRNLSKLKSTYVDTLILGAEKSVVWPDGKIHPVFKTTSTDTGRLSSEQPNGQNWPKRKNKEVRKQIVAPPGHYILAADFGQIEARVIGMASKDPSFCKALREDYDIHLEWAERVAKLYPPAFKARDGDMKKFRSEIKNQLVFPAFYGAQPRSIAGYIGIPPEKADLLFKEFWQTFKGVKKWQEELKKFYLDHDYVECLTGRRRRGPLSFNMVANSPIQGTASDIVVDAMVRLSRRSREEKKPYLQFVLNIHDDLTFFVPKEKKEKAIEEIVKEMLAIRWDWVNVPLSAEVEIGENWYEMKSVGTFRSDRL